MHKGARLRVNTATTSIWLDHSLARETRRRGLLSSRNPALDRSLVSTQLVQSGQRD